MKVWILILLCLLLPGSAWAADRPSFVLEGETFLALQQNVYKMGIYDQPLSETEIRQILDAHRYEFSEDYLMEYQRYVYWAMPLENRNSTATRIFLRYPMRMEQTRSWLYVDGQLQEFARFPVAFDLYYIEIPPGRSLIVGMRLSGGDVKGRATSIKVQDFSSTAWLVAFEQHVMGAVTGAVAIMVLYNLGMFLFFRKIYFLYYTIYSASTMYCVAIFASYIKWVVPHLGTGLAISGVGLVLFGNSALSLRNTHPTLYKISMALLVYCVGFGIAIWFFPSWNLVSISMPLALLFSTYTSVQRSLDGYRPAYYLLIGWCVLLSCAVLSTLNIAYIGSSMLSNIGIAGFAVEICFFSFAIGQKVRLSEQRALRESEHAFNQLKKVFYAHQIQQIKSGLELEKTMPTGKGQAAVISFDIIESSRIEQPHAKTFIENSIKSCVSIISENYDPEQLRANGYRIKEVGDGFLCSIGYPFALPEGVHPAQCAVELSLRFIQIFQNQVDQLRDHAPIYCSIGVAFDWLEGYFPKVGTIEYDVYGRAVILATRYEAFRRQLFPNGVKGHILTLHEKIYEHLSPELKAGFQEFDLHRAHLVVRDDLGVSRLYFRVIQPAEIQELEQEAS